ncbi:MAG: YjjG family noncanonical pyrimidine nucleotidase [Cyclobacteriaceae bacterium]|nr:YjjG family noncanonical pyrimidine nucleotidase [Cyclobacteriaceae bacterium]UYN87697.1 MAG: YjjG family noncanonical pyrimidine nucleotidase [Cyclobacteriaceae bacterium]
MTASYTTIFFDLDHTLWDYETNARETLIELYNQHQLHNLGVVTFDEFLKHFKEVNRQLWHLYDHGKITSEVIRSERFKQILEKSGIKNNELSLTLSEQYLNECPRKGHLIPHAQETLDYLSDRYALTVITNGFEDIQRIKILTSKIESYFDHIVTSQKAGFKKPAPEIFQYAMNMNGIDSTACIMIGDNLLTDIAGAKNASIDAVLFNPDGVEHEAEVNHEIRSLKELCTLL